MIKGKNLHKLLPLRGARITVVIIRVSAITQAPILYVRLIVRRTAGNIAMFVTNILKMMNLSPGEHKRQGHRVNRRIPPPLQKEPSLLIQIIKVSTVRRRAKERKRRDLKVGPEVAAIKPRKRRHGVTSTGHVAEEVGFVFASFGKVDEPGDGVVGGDVLRVGAGKLFYSVPE